MHRFGLTNAYILLILFVIVCAFGLSKFGYIVPAEWKIWLAVVCLPFAFLRLSEDKLTKLTDTEQLLNKKERQRALILVEERRTFNKAIMVIQFLLPLLYFIIVAVKANAPDTVELASGREQFFIILANVLFITAAVVSVFNCWFLYNEQVKQNRFITKLNHRLTDKKNKRAALKHLSENDAV